MRLLDVQGQGIQNKNYGGGEYEASGYALSIVEIKALTSDEQVGVYEEVDYNAGSVFGDT